MQNLFADLPDHLSDELISVLAESQHVRIERIVSTGQTSPTDFWYDQREHEWVVVLQGEAEIHFAGEDAPRRFVPGDHVLIPARQRHRVTFTSKNKPTVWLAVFFSEDE